ncbi:restriction endonuclease subunit S [Streptomyces sp. NPDC086554]|uniref:restriction endonuclease subunit S n=1 Tax=Streptomyces sp. NPDC086554 TaxID=3154864 RepID=UPI00342D3D7C
MRNSQVPPGWSESKVGEHFDMTLGKMLSKAAGEGRKQFKYLTNRNVQWGRFDLRDLESMHFSESEQRLYSLRPGDLLVTEGGEIGRTAMWEGINAELFFQKSLHRLRATGAIDPCYLLHYMSFAARRGLFSHLAGQTSIAHLTKEKLANWTILHPDDLGEQRRIVEVLAALAEEEKSIEALIKKSHLVRGEIARDALFGQQVASVAIRDMAAVSSGSTPSRSRGEYWSGGTVPWVRTAEINFNVITATGECVTPKAVADTGLRVYPRGTVLLAMYGEGVTRGRSAVLGVEATVNQAAAAIVCDPQQLDHQYLHYWLESSYGEIRKIGQGSNQTNLNGSLVGAIRVPLPSLDEQRRLVAPIEAFDRKLAADALELSKLRTFKQGLTDDLLSGKVRMRGVA